MENLRKYFEVPVSVVFSCSAGYSQIRKEVVDVILESLKARLNCCSDKLLLPVFQKFGP